MVHWEAWRGREPEDGVETKRKNALHILYLRQLPTVTVHQNYYHTLKNNPKQHASKHLSVLLKVNSFLCTPAVVTAQ